MSNGNESAYPQQLVEDRHGDLQPASAFYDVGGLTKRELIAAMAMQGLLASGDVQFHLHTAEGVLLVPARKAIPSLAVEHADALLAALQANCGEAGRESCP